MQPASAEEARLPSLSIGNTNEEKAPGRQHIVELAEDGTGVAHVLQAVPQGNALERRGSFGFV